MAIIEALYAVVVIAAGAAANLLFAGMFVARVGGSRWSRPLGFAGTAMAVPLAAASLVALGAGLDVWLIVLPGVFVAFALFEVYVDVLADVEVRSTRWLWPYLAGFYLAQWAVIGAAFLASPIGGTAVLVTYFVCLAATGWSYRRVGHGDEAIPGHSPVLAERTDP